MREDWIEVELGEVCDVKMGQSPPSSTYNTDKIGLPFFQGKAEFRELHPTVKKWCSEPKRIASINDILLSVRAPVGATNVANRECSIGRGLAAISYKHSYKYIYYYLRCIEQKLDSQGTGTTFRAISGNVLKTQRIPFSPLPIQRAIVAKIETLFSDLDNGIANLTKAQKQLKIYRQAALKKAFNLESKKYKIESVSKDIFAGGDKPKDFFSNIKTKELSIPILANAIANNGLYGYTKKARVNEIAITIAGRGSGTGHIELRKEPFFPIVRLITVIPDLEKVTAEYLMYFLKNLNIKGSGSAIPQLTIPMVKSIEIYLPTLQEQNQIVQEIESRLSVCDKVEQSISESLEQAKALRQSILKKAFEGKLLSKEEIEACKQERDYEPAPILLEKIKAEKVKAQNLAPKKKTKKKAKK